jgi:hypothetical protein
VVCDKGVGDAARGEEEHDSLDVYATTEGHSATVGSVGRIEVRMRNVMACSAVLCRAVREFRVGLAYSVYDTQATRTHCPSHHDRRRYNDAATKKRGTTPRERPDAHDERGHERKVGKHRGKILRCNSL